MYLRPGNRLWLSTIGLLFFVVACSASSVLQTDNDLVFEDADQLEKNILYDKWHDNTHNNLVDIVHQSIKRVKRFSFLWDNADDSTSTTSTETIEQSDSTSLLRRGVRTTDDITTTTSAATTVHRGDTSMMDDEDDNTINSGDGEGSGDAEDNHSGSKSESKSTTSLTSPITTTETAIQNITTSTSSTTTMTTSTVSYDPFAPSQVLIIYRVYMTVNEPYISDYANPKSEPFIWLANNFSTALNEALHPWTNDVEPRVVEIKPSADNFLIEVTVDIETSDRQPQDTLETFLKYFVDHSRDYNPSITVIDKGFRVVRAFTGRKHRCFPGDKLCLPTDTCLPPESTCNGKLDCPDGSDEQNCPTTTPRLRTAMNSFNSFNSTCAPGQFQCDGGGCILSWRRCNGIEDCLDRTDELGCSRTFGKCFVGIIFFYLNELLADLVSRVARFRPCGVGGSRR